MKRNVLMILCLLVAVAACSRDKQVLPCNKNTLLLRFTCESDLSEADALGFQLLRGDGQEANFSSSNLRCPGELAYEVAMPSYAEGQTFKVTATPTKMGSALGEPNVVPAVPLIQGCTAVAVPLTAKGGIVVTPVPGQEGGVPPDGDGGTEVPVERGSKENAVACTTGSECMSGFCADGVCCNNACKGSCEACNLQGSSGQCSPVANGEAPAAGKMCQTEAASTCGFDGKCNGEGACRKWPDGSVCVAGQCEGAGTRGRKVCKAGTCDTSNDLVCAPFACNAASVTCYAECEDSTMCESGKACAVDADTGKKSCGKKPLGAVCAKGPECESGNCADGVCCSTACEGACRSCNLVGFMGECKNLAAGANDDRKICKASDVGACGQTGKCDGNGGCSLFAKGSVCSPAKCSGSDGIPPSECDGSGSCVAGRPLACAPFVCAGNACLTKCTSDDQCAGGTSCVNGSCGLLPNGAVCNAATQCSSGQCVDGVCCNSACSGTCQFCALATAKGTCTDVAANVDDPRGKCGVTSSSTCGNNGKCDGQKGCQKWPQGTECQGRSCDAASNTESFAKQCDGLGTCAVTKQPAGCAPFTCGANACGTTCSRDDQCVAPNTCINGLCGKRRDGQACGNKSQCLSGNCEQGVCCATACSGTCKSCAVAGKEGSCENIPGGQDPLNQCDATASSTCKTTGTCNGNGQCAVHGAGVICEGAKCSTDSSQEIGSSTCDGAGTCKAPAAITCSGSLVCSGSACKGSCATDTDCRGGTKCNSRTKQCGTPNGQACGGNDDCGSDRCADGFCCNSACSGACESCRNTDTGAGNGVCAPIPNGVNDGSCAGASCSGNNATPASTCNGSRACSMPSPVSCGEFACSGGACLSSCSAQSPCSDTNKTCVNGQCKKKQGVVCGGGTECASGFCPDGVCCNSACGGACQACGSGTCTPIASGMNDGSCTGISCANAALTPASTCNGSGACTTPAGQACGSNLTCQNSVSCRTTCSVSADCTGGRVCWNGECLNKVTISLAPDYSRVGWIYSQGTLGDPDGYNFVLVGDSGFENAYARAFFSFSLANIPSNAKAFAGGRLTLTLTGGGDGDYYALGPVIIEHVRASSISLAAFSATPFQTLGANPGSLLTSLVCFSSGLTGSTIIDVGSAVFQEFQTGQSSVQFRFRSGTYNTDYDGRQDTIGINWPGTNSLQIDALVP